MITTGVRRSILERIGQGDQTAIAALIKRFHSTEPIPKRVFQSLEKIVYGNAMAIATLIQLIRTSDVLPAPPLSGDGVGFSWISPRAFYTE